MSDSGITRLPWGVNEPVDDVTQPRPSESAGGFGLLRDVRSPGVRKATADRVEHPLRGVRIRSVDALRPGPGRSLWAAVLRIASRLGASLMQKVRVLSSDLSSRAVAL